MAAVRKTRASASRGVVLGRRVRAAVGVTHLNNRIGIDALNYPSTVANKDRTRNVPLHCQRVPSLPGTLRGPWPRGGLREDEQGKAITVQAMNTRTASRTLRSHKEWFASNTRTNQSNKKTTRKPPLFCKVFICDAMRNADYFKSLRRFLYAKPSDLIRRRSLGHSSPLSRLDIDSGSCLSSKIATTFTCSWSMK